MQNPLKAEFCSNTLTLIINPYIEKVELVLPFMMFPHSGILGFAYLARYVWAVWFITQTEIESYFHIVEIDEEFNELF